MTIAELLKNSNGQFGGAANQRAVRDDSAGDYGESINPEGMSIASWLKAKGSDIGGGAVTSLSKLLGYNHQYPGKY